MLRPTAAHRRPAVRSLTTHCSSLPVQQVVGPEQPRGARRRDPSGWVTDALKRYAGKASRLLQDLTTAHHGRSGSSRQSGGHHGSSRALHDLAGHELVPLPTMPLTAVTHAQVGGGVAQAGRTAAVLAAHPAASASCSPRPPSHATPAASYHPTNSAPCLLALPLLPSPPLQGLGFIFRKKAGVLLSVAWEEAFLMARHVGEDGKEQWSGPIFCRGRNVSLGLTGGACTPGGPARRRAERHGPRAVCLDRSRLSLASLSHAPAGFMDLRMCLAVATEEGLHEVTAAMLPGTSVTQAAALRTALAPPPPLKPNALCSCRRPPNPRRSSARTAPLG